MLHHRMVFTKPLPRDRYIKKEMLSSTKAAASLSFFISEEDKSVIDRQRQKSGFCGTRLQVFTSLRQPPATPTNISNTAGPGGNGCCVCIQLLGGLTPQPLSPFVCDLSPFFKNKNDSDARRRKTQLDGASFVPGRPRVFLQTLAAIL